uniref:Glycosyltransferase n=1 Tax=viral metagenome TaxID=1070528 RepID=A0A6M3KUD2_9ZZZZ
MNNVILFVSHKKAQCGVYEFGKDITDALQHSMCYQFVRVECSSLPGLRDAITENNPIGIIYNYSPLVFPWMNHKIRSITSVPQIGIIHDITQYVADTATSEGVTGINSLFNFYIAPDPTLLSSNPLVYKTGRLVPQYQGSPPDYSELTIGSFGFGTPGKGFEKIVQLVQHEFDVANIRFNIPAADFGDYGGINAKAIAEQCKTQITKPGIRLNITHEYLDRESLLDFLAQNTINVFLYEDTGDRGLSSAIDIAMAVRRPIAVSGSIMFRHLHDVKPSICITGNSLKSIIENGFTPLQKHYEEWSSENLLRDYERTLDSIFLKQRSVI